MEINKNLQNQTECAKIEGRPVKREQRQCHATAAYVLKESLCIASNHFFIVIEEIKQIKGIFQGGSLNDFGSPMAQIYLA